MHTDHRDGGFGSHRTFSPCPPLLCLKYNINVNLGQTNLQHFERCFNKQLYNFFLYEMMEGQRKHYF